MDTARIWYIEKFRRRLGLVTNALQLLPLCQDQPAGRQSRCCNQLRWPYSTFWSGFHKRPKASGSCAKWGTERPGPYASVQSRLDRSNVTCVWPTTEVQHVHGATSPRPLWLLLWPRVWHVHNVPMYGKFSRHAGQTQIQQGSRIPQKMVTQPLSRKNAHSNDADGVGILPLFRKRYHLQCTLSERLLSHQHLTPIIQVHFWDPCLLQPHSTSEFEDPRRKESCQRAALASSSICYEDAVTLTQSDSVFVAFLEMVEMDTNRIDLVKDNSLAHLGPSRLILHQITHLTLFHEYHTFHTFPAVSFEAVKRTSIAAKFKN